MKTELKIIESPQCEYFVQRKKRRCRMSVRPGRRFCGEHEPSPVNEDGQPDTRIPCPYDPKHTCFQSKLVKHLQVCNSRPRDLPPYIVNNVNAPAAVEAPIRKPLGQYPKEQVTDVILKINQIYDKEIHSHIQSLPEKDIHAVVLAEFSEKDRTESSLRHLRQASRLLQLVEDEGLVEEETCYVELGAGKGHLSYYACQAWCQKSSRSLLVDRAALRHKRDNKLTHLAVERLRADLAHLALEKVPAVELSRTVVGVAKHLCGVATDYALRCITNSSVLAKSRGVALATCCHHQCDWAGYIAHTHLQALGLTAEDFNVMLSVVSWYTCGNGRSRDKRSSEPSSDVTQDKDKLTAEEREEIGRRAKAIIDWARVLYLREKGFNAQLCHFVPTSVSLENVCIIASKKV